MQEFTAIAIGNAREDIFAIVRGAQEDLSDARKLLADGVFVLRRGRAQAVKVNLLVEIQIGRGTLALARIAGVPETGGVAIPGQATPGSGSIDARHVVPELLPRPAVQNKNAALFPAPF